MNISKYNVIKLIHHIVKLLAGILKVYRAQMGSSVCIAANVRVFCNNVYSYSNKSNNKGFYKNLINIKE